MTITRYPAHERGHNNFGWLDTNHTFSFGEYHDPERIHFGALRVFNDDVVIGGAGFGTHPHRDMEIISIPLEGVIMHRDSMGHEQPLRPGEIQVMSAGTGITHSEYNGSATDPLKFLQIWIIPQERGVTPRYDQVSVGDLDRNAVHTIVGPNDAGLPLWIHQRAYLSIARLDQGASVSYATRDAGNGVFTFVIDGSVDVQGTSLAARDAVGIDGTERIDITAQQDSYVVIIDVPML